MYRTLYYTMYLRVAVADARAGGKVCRKVANLHITEWNEPLCQTIIRRDQSNHTSYLSVGEDILRFTQI